MRSLHRPLGAALLLLSLLPLYRLLDPERTGLAGAATVNMLAVYSEFMSSGTLLVLPFALLAALLLQPEWVDRTAARLRWLERPSPLVFALVLAGASGALTALFTGFILEGVPNHLDGIAQLLHARYWADGRLAGPTDDGGGFWLIQNSLFTPRGWVSQYPPGHVALLALGVRLGAVPAVGAVLVALTVFFWTLFADRLLAPDRLVARLGALLLACCPFLLFLGGSFMNHITVAAAVGTAAWAGLRALQGRAAWALLAGAALAYAVATRPLSALALGLALLLTLPAAAGRRLLERRSLPPVLLAALGALPVLALLFAYNDAMFGGWLASGYAQTLGPEMRLGFHRDPWGNLYGLREALAYTSADLTALSVNLLETPLPSVAVIGAFLLVVRTLHPGGRVLAALAVAPVLTNALYWHHGLFMGPRMLHESAPAWVLLFALAAVGLVRAIPRERVLLGLGVRSGAAAALLASTAFGLIVLAPQRALSYGGGWLAVTRTPVPRPPEPALVFVHDAWTARVGMTLAAGGMRLDRVETLLRQNSTCSVHTMAAAHPQAARRRYDLLDTEPRANRLPPSVEITPGDTYRALPGETLTPDCLRQLQSDRFGILDLAPLHWQGDLPHQEPEGPLFVRDLGPLRNPEALARFPGRRPYVYTMSAPDGAPVLLPYEEGMRRLWSAPAQ